MESTRLATTEVFDLTANQSAPSSADFLLDNKRPSTPSSIEVTPSEELTGLPLPVLVKSADYYHTNGTSRMSDYHHHFHPQRCAQLGYDAKGARLPKGDPDRTAGFALRYSRGQDLPIWLHTRYHEIFYGPELPNDNGSKFTSVVLACAGVVPREAIDLYTPGEFAKVAIDHRQHEFIRRRIYFEGAVSNNSRRNHIGKFIAEHALASALGDVMSESQVRKKVDEFLKPKTEAQRIEAGRFILHHVVDASIADLIPIHQEAKKEGMTKKSKKSLGEIVLKFFTTDRFRDYFEPLEDQLSLLGI